MQRNKSTISWPIKGVPENGELIADSVVAFFATTVNGGKNRQKKYVLSQSVKMDYLFLGNELRWGIL